MRPAKGVLLTPLILYVLWGGLLWVSYERSRPIVLEGTLARGAIPNTTENQPIYTFGVVNSSGTPVGRFPNLYYGITRAQFTPELGEELLYWESKKGSAEAYRLQDELVSALDADGVRNALKWIAERMSGSTLQDSDIAGHLAFRLGQITGRQAIDEAEQLQLGRWHKQNAQIGWAYGHPAEAVHWLAEQGATQTDPQANTSVLHWATIAHPEVVHALLADPALRARLSSEYLDEYEKTMTHLGRLDLCRSSFEPGAFSEFELPLRLQMDPLPTLELLRLQVQQGEKAVFDLDTDTGFERWLAQDRKRAALSEAYNLWLEGQPAEALPHWNEYASDWGFAGYVNELAEQLSVFQQQDPAAYAAWMKGIEPSQGNDPLAEAQVLMLSTTDPIQAHSALAKIQDRQRQQGAALDLISNWIQNPKLLNAQAWQVILQSEYLDASFRHQLTRVRSEAEAMALIRDEMNRIRNPES